MRDGFSALNGMVAKREEKKVQLRANWETVKNGVMEEVVRAKFWQNPDLLQKLLDTGDPDLTEGNGWHAPTGASMCEPAGEKTISAGF